MRSDERASADRVAHRDIAEVFGGHAKRNEFNYKGRTLNIESPERYNAPSKELLADIGIDLDRFMSDNAEPRQLYRRMGLGSAYFFDKETWNEDRFVRGSGGRRGARFDAAFLAKTPLSEKAQKDLLKLYGPDQPDYMPGLSSAEKKVRLARMSYTDFMLNVVKVDEQVMWFFQNTGQGTFAVGADALPALFAWQTGQL